MKEGAVAGDVTDFLMMEGSKSAGGLTVAGVEVEVAGTNVSGMTMLG
jgi:hypothetical protein